MALEFFYLLFPLIDLGLKLSDPLRGGIDLFSLFGCCLRGFRLGYGGLRLCGCGLGGLCGFRIGRLALVICSLNGPCGFNSGNGGGSRCGDTEIHQDIDLLPCFYLGFKAADLSIKILHRIGCGLDLGRKGNGKGRILTYDIVGRIDGLFLRLCRGKGLPCVCKILLGRVYRFL